MRRRTAATSTPATSKSSRAATTARAGTLVSYDGLLADRWAASTLAGGQSGAAAATSDVDVDVDAAVVGGAAAVVGGDAGAGTAGAAIVRVATCVAGAGRAGAAAREAAGALACSGRRKISVTYSTLPAQ